jgi:hypothetical protein
MRQLYLAKEVGKEVMYGFSHVFRDALRPIPNLTTFSSSPGVREPISVAILLNLLGKKEE